MELSGGFTFNNILWFLVSLILVSLVPLENFLVGDLSKRALLGD
jgi:hypothetical protein